MSPVMVIAVWAEAAHLYGRLIVKLLDCAVIGCLAIGDRTPEGLYVEQH